MRKSLRMQSAFFQSECTSTSSWSTHCDAQHRSIKIEEIWHWHKTGRKVTWDITFTSVMQQVMQHCTVGMNRISFSNGSQSFKKSYFFSFFSFFSFDPPPAALPSCAFSRAFSFSFSALAAACKNKESARNIFDHNAKKRLHEHQMWHCFSSRGQERARKLRGSTYRCSRIHGRFSGFSCSLLFRSLRRCRNRVSPGNMHCEERELRAKTNELD